ncbi:MAG TPA: protein kinase [Vicinamibacterales bacterium]|nr:protein kinase [Vicinamibacterales bacterium]
MSRCIACGAAVLHDAAHARVAISDTLAANALTFAEEDAPDEAIRASAALAPDQPAPQQIEHAGPLTAGQQFGTRYKILRLLGVGGMGAVYEAHDDELNESVALKVIKSEAAAGPTHEVERRFKQELLLARQVTHRNVVRIHDLGEIDGIKYLTMTYIDGADLADVLHDVGRLEVPTALKLARQVAAGLQAAHEAGVIHRDLKPANIMIDGDHAIIMDFGIARSAKARQATMVMTAGVRSGASPGVTTMGTMIGTLDYMAPEQALGHAVDQRVDIYAFGLIFYDMLLGSRELLTGGLAPLDALMARIDRAPPPIRTLRPDVPPALERVITTCVQPDQEARYQSAEQLLAALDALDRNGNPLPSTWHFTTRLLAAAAAAVLAMLGGVWWAARPEAVPVSPEPVTVLIADFQNRTDEPAFTGALEQALTIGVEAAPFITAYSRPSALALATQLTAGKRLDDDAARLVAMREGVNVVLAGVIEPSWRGFTVTTNVVDAADGRVLGTRTASARNRDAVPSAVGTLAAAVRELLGDPTSEAARSADAETLTAASLEAVREYAIAQDLAGAVKDEQALVHFQKAIALDPKFGRAYSGLALVTGRLGRDAEAEAAWKMALSLTDRMTDREKYRTLGFYYTFTRNYTKAIDTYTEFLAKYPTDTSGHNNLAISYVNTLRFAEALDEGRAVMKLNPQRVLYHTNVALYAMYAGQFDVAAAEATAVLKKDPSAHKAYLAQAAAAFFDGDAGAVEDAYARMAAAGPRGASLAALGAADFAIAEGRFRDAIDLLRDGIANDRATGNTAGQAAKQIALGDAYAELGERERAVAAVQEALAASRNYPVVVSAAELLFRVGRTAEARALVDELETKLPAQPRAYARIAAAAQQLREKRHLDAIETLQAAQKVLDLWLGRYVLGLAYLQAGHPAEALAELESCMKRRGEATALFIDDMPTFRRIAALPSLLTRAQHELGVTAVTAAQK